MGGTEGTEMDGMQILCKMHANKHLGAPRAVSALD